MGDKQKPESETMDVLIGEQMRSLCAQFDAECREAQRAGGLPRLEAYVVQVPEAGREPFRAELEKIQQSHQHTQIQPEDEPIAVTVERSSDAQGADTAQGAGPGTIDFTPDPESTNAQDLPDASSSPVVCMSKSNLALHFSSI
jgi:hypothetical protein